MPKRLIDTEAWVKAQKEAGEPAGIRKAFASLVEKAAEPNTLRFTISTAAIDRQGDTVAIDGWKLDNYLANPVVLWCHKYDCPPVAQAPSIGVKGKKLVSEAKFAVEIDPFFNMVYRLYAEGYMRAVSVGFDPIKWAFSEEPSRRGVDFYEQELLEYSCVPVPANPQALIQARSVSGIDTAPLKRWAEQVLDCAAGSVLDIGGFTASKEFVAGLAKAADAAEPVSFSMPALDFETKDADPETPDPNEQPPSGPSENQDAAPEQTDAENDMPIPDGGASGEPEESAGNGEAPASDPSDGQTIQEPEESNEAATDPLPPAERVAARSDVPPADWPEFRHHRADGAVVWLAVVASMEALMRGQNATAREFGQAAKVLSPEAAYQHLAAHYRDDFDTEPPEYRFVSSQCLKHFGDMMFLEPDTGQIQTVTQERRDAAMAEEWIRSIEESAQQMGDTFRRAGMEGRVKTALALLRGEVGKENSGNAEEFPLELFTEIARETIPGAIEMALRTINR